MGEPALRVIATELVKSIKSNVSVDWMHREAARVLVKRLLRKYGYPPDLQDAAVQKVLQQAEALTYLHDCGIKMARRSYFRYKKKVESMKWQRLIHASNLFTEQHLQRIDRLELVEELMWKH